MAQGSTTGSRALVRGAEQALDRFKYEVARDIGLHIPEDNYWGDLPARQCGAVGGHMVRKMIEMAENSLAGRAR
jgi:small acid-soluble spore protein A (major alpha-type SASP)